MHRQQVRQAFHTHLQYMSYLFAEMLTRLLSDPIIKSRVTLYRLLSKRKTEAHSASHHLKENMLKARKGLSPDMRIFSDERSVCSALGFSLLLF